VVFDDASGYGQAVMGMGEDDFVKNTAFRHGIYAMARFRRAEMEPYVRVNWNFGGEGWTDVGGLTGGSIVLGMTVKGDILTVGGAKAQSAAGKGAQGQDGAASPPTGELHDIL
jgi:hypothetical protein